MAMMVIWTILNFISALTLLKKQILLVPHFSYKCLYFHLKCFSYKQRKKRERETFDYRNFLVEFSLELC